MTKEPPSNVITAELMDGPVLASVRQVKQELSSRYGHDVGRLFAHLREVEATSGRTYVDRRSRTRDIVSSAATSPAAR